MPLIRLVSNADGRDMWVHSAHIVAITQEYVTRDDKKVHVVSRVVTTNGVFVVKDEASFIANKPAMQYSGKK